jgi:hypothetical protein
MKIFQSMAEAGIEGSDISKSEVIEALRTESVGKWMIDRTMKTMDVPEEYKDQAIQEISKSLPPEKDMRTNFFMILLGIAGQSRGAIFIIEEYRAGNVKVYPETIMFKVIRYAPQSAIDLVGKQVSEKQKVLNE